MGLLIDDSELKLYDSFVSEYNYLGGVKIKIWSLKKSRSYDTLWDEPSSKYGESNVNYKENNIEEWVFSGPYEVWSVIEFTEEEYMTSTVEEGVTGEWEGIVWIGRSDLDKLEIPYPKKGDIIEIDSWGDREGNILYFDVINSKRSGALGDTQSYVQFRLEIKRRTKFDAIRKIDKRGSQKL